MHDTIDLKTRAPVYSIILNAHTSILMHPRDFNGSCTTRFIVESLEILRSFLRFPRQIDGEIFFAAFGDELTDTLGTTLTCNFVLQTDDDASLIDGERDSERCGIDESAFFFFKDFTFIA